VLDYYKGMTRLALEHGVVIIGGNLTTSPIVTSTVSIVGEIRPELLMTRSAAHPGDAIAVTGLLGGAAAALALLDSGSPMKTPAYLLHSLLRPQARLHEAHVLAELGVRCAIDISDGLLGDLEHICARSGVSATVHSAQVPHFVDDAIPAGDQTMFALTGGENYELMFTCAPTLVERVAAALSCPVTIVGEIMAPGDSPSVIVLVACGEPVKIDRPGWRHFAA
jgi:thiamine-monophosphate kinase